MEGGGRLLSWAIDGIFLVANAKISSLFRLLLSHGKPGVSDLCAPPGPMCLFKFLMRVKDSKSVFGSFLQLLEGLGQVTL